jgi:enoyl-CoA hydratase/carnithine racemase
MELGERMSDNAGGVVTVNLDLVEFQIDGSVAILTWNRPKQNNAWTPALERAYFARLRQAADDPEVRTIVVTGAGRNFCPGTDMQALSQAAGGDRSADPDHREPQTFPMSIPKPIIAAINGACAGTGFIQAAVSDIRFAEADARLTPAFARRGIMAEHGLSVLLPRIIGISRAMDVLLSARAMSGQELYETGFITHLSKPGQVLPDAVAYAKQIAALCSPLALAVTKKQIYDSFANELEAARREALGLWRVVRNRPDFGEGVASFIEDRQPVFPGLTPSVLEAVLTERRLSDGPAPAAE